MNNYSHAAKELTEASKNLSAISDAVKQSAIPTKKTTKDRLLDMIIGADDKPSATGLIGILLTLTGLLLFIVLIGFYFTHTSEAVVIMAIIDKAIIIISIGSTMLGARKLAGAIGHRNVGPTDLKGVLDVIEQNIEIAERNAKMLQDAQDAHDRSNEAIKRSQSNQNSNPQD